MNNEMSIWDLVLHLDLCLSFETMKKLFKDGEVFLNGVSVKDKNTSISDGNYILKVRNNKLMINIENKGNYISTMRL